LALYGVLRWGTLLTPAPIWRLLGLLALALLVAGPGRALGARSRALTILGAVVAVAAMFALAGLPLAWVRHVRIAVSADAIGQGLSSLPGVLVPYTGINEWVRMVTVLGAGVLLLDAALMLAFAPRTLGEMRRAIDFSLRLSVGTVESEYDKFHKCLEGRNRLSRQAGSSNGHRSLKPVVVSCHHRISCSPSFQHR